MSLNLSGKPIPNFLLFLSLILLGFLAFSPALYNNFVVLDDGFYVVDNPIVNRIGSDFWFHLFFGNHAGNLHPLTMANHIIDLHLFSCDPFWHHAESLVWHMITGLLLFRLLWMLFENRDVAWLATLIWMIHPLQVESVAWVSERKNLLSTLLFIISLMCWLRFEKSGKWTHWLSALATFFFGLLAKSMLVTLPCVLLLLRLRTVSRPLKITNIWGSLKPVIGWTVPFFLLTFIISWVTVFFQGSAGAMDYGSDYGGLVRVLNATHSYGTYLVQFFWPTHLAAMYPLEMDFSTGTWLAKTVFFFCFLALIALRSKKLTWTWIGLFFFLGTLVPVIGLVQVGIQAHADRYMYLPMIGLCMMLGDLPKHIVFPRPVFLILLCGALGLAYVSAQQTRTWRSTRSLFENAIEQGNHNWYALYILLREDVFERKFDQAKQRLRQLTEWLPDDALTHYCEIMIAVQEGSTDEAEVLLEEFLEVIPDYEKALVDYARIAMDRKDYELAIQRASRVLEMYPENEEGWLLLADANMAAGNNIAAEKAYLHLLDLAPVESVFKKLERFYKGKGDQERASYFNKRWSRAFQFKAI